MNDDDLMRRISDGLSAPGSLDADDELRELLDADPEARLYADDLLAIDEALVGLKPAMGEDRDWDALAAAITDRLDDELDDIGDVAGPPPLDEEIDVSGPVLSERAIAAARAEAEAPVAAARASAPAVGVVDLAEERRRRRRTMFTVIGGLAAAAAVGLGITAGISLSGDTRDMQAAPSFFDEEEESAEAVAEATVADMGAEDEAMAAEEPAEVGLARGYGESLGGVDTPAPAPAPDPEPMLELAEAEEDLGDYRAEERQLAQRMPAGAGGGREAMAQAPAPMAAPAPTTSSPARRASMRPQIAADRAAGDEPTRVQTQEALYTANAEVQRCMNRHDEVARVTVTVRGQDGVITDAQVAPPFGGTSAGECIARAVRRVRMPTSSSATYRAAHAYQPRPVAGSSEAPLAPASRSRRARPARSMDVMDPFGN
jgi:hypothetical protein